MLVKSWMFSKGLLYPIIYIPCKGIPNLVRRQNSGGKGKKKIRPGTIYISCHTIIALLLDPRIKKDGLETIGLNRNQVTVTGQTLSYKVSAVDNCY